MRLHHDLHDAPGLLQANHRARRALTMITIIYDGDCPLCADYMRRLRLVETCGVVELVDARAASPLTRSYWARGYNIDEGMIVVIGETVFYGAEAVTTLARLSSNSTLFNKIQHWALSRGTISRLAYPLMKICRRLALRLRGRKALPNPINSADQPHR
jgi:predicted DCC family thiol-disulfide oxidoreductase YuxK